MTPDFTLIPGEGPLLVTIPHAGTGIPENLRSGYTDVGLSSVDADTNVDVLYRFTRTQEITTLVANLSRYVIDLNRPPEDDSLYPGQFTTGLLPTVSFKKEALYKDGCEPDRVERGARIRQFYFPYHYQIEKILNEKKQKFGRALLWDAHSIKSEVPSLFEGRLPDFNFGTFSGKSCGLPVKEAFSKVMEQEFPAYSFVFNGRFKGGYTTRHYGKPSENIHAVQLELSQAAYMNEETGEYSEAKAARVKPVLARLLEEYLSL